MALISRRTSLSAARARIAALAVSCVLAGAPAVRAQGGGEDELYAFQIYDTQAARALAESAREHLEASRWSEALVDLQALIEDHRGEVLPGARPVPRSGSTPSEQWVHEGASAWATRTLFELPREARVLYERRYGDRAAQAFSAAVEVGDRGGLSAVARRWPLTDEGLRAWWALGDLELERGYETDAFRAWGRGLARALGRASLELGRPAQWRAALEQLDAAEDVSEGRRAGIRARVEYLLRTLANGDDGNVQDTERIADRTALGPSGPFGRTLGPENDGWPTPYSLPTHPLQKSYTQYRLFPTRLGDTLFVNTTRDVIAIGAYTGEELWRAGESLAGWDRVSSSDKLSFAAALDYSEMLVAPAAAQGVVTAVLQIPHAFELEDAYGDLEIIKRIPERRLFAFDAATGRPLWNTLPPPMWDGESGTFAQRTTIVGSPVIAGSRVLVPAAQLRGRIEFHVGCFDLFSGELLWSTPLITGQRGLNMFGRSMKEFSAPPVRVTGNRVIALTQLGVLAALDLFTGETLWETLYSQIPIPLSQYYNPSALQPVWANAPPVVVDGTIVATPMDSYEAIGVEQETGAVIWSRRQGRFVDDLGGSRGRRSSPPSAVRVLLGADEKRVYFGGQKVSAFEAHSGVALGAPTQRRWVWPVDETLSRDLPQAVLAADELYVPDRNELIRLDARSGRIAGRVSWLTSPGNVLLGDGVLFTLNSYRLSGHFEWQEMVDRARAFVRERPTDSARAQNLALLLLERGIAEMLQGKNVDAKGHLEDGRRVLEQHVPDGDESADPALRATLHELLRQEARNLRRLADPGTALRRLARARELAPTHKDALDTLLVEQAILRERSLTDWRATLELILADYADMSVLCEAERASGLQPWRGDIAPVVAQLAGASVTPQLVLPVGLWVLIERSQSWSRERGVAANRAEFADLHAILHGYGDVDVLGLRAGEWAAQRIGQKLAAGERGGYEDYEAQAAETLQRARTEEDMELLQRIPELYPHSRAAAASNDERLSLSLASGDVEVVAEIVLGDLPLSWSPKEATEREVQNLLRLAEVLGAAGNLELRAGLARSLAASHPRLTYEPAESAPLPVAELAERWRAPERPASAAASATFGGKPSTAGVFPGSFGLLAEIPPRAGEEDRVLLFADRSRLYAFSDAAPDQTAWVTFLGSQDDLDDDTEDRVVATPGLVHLASARRIFTLERASGEELWRWDSVARGLVRLVSADGVVVAVERQGGLGDKSGRHRLIGLDAVSGIELWRLSFDSGEQYWFEPIVGEGRMVIVPRNAPAQAQSFDLFTGRHLASFEVAPHSSFNVRAAWIQNGRLVLPQFLRSTRPQHNHLEAYTVDTGERAWRVDLDARPGGPHELTKIVTHAGRHFLFLATAASERTGVYELNVGLGALDSSPKLSLRAEDRPVGLPDRRRIELATPLLFVSSEAAAGDLYTIRAHDVRFGGRHRWQANLPRKFLRTLLGEMPLPAVSETTVAVAYRIPDAQSRLRTELLFFDRNTGQRLDNRTLPATMTSTTGRISFAPLGDALFVSGARQMELLR